MHEVDSMKLNRPFQLNENGWWTSSTTSGTTVCMLSSHIQPFFLPNDISTHRLESVQILEIYKLYAHRLWNRVNQRVASHQAQKSKKRSYREGERCWTPRLKRRKKKMNEKKKQFKTSDRCTVKQSRRKQSQVFNVKSKWNVLLYSVV